MGFRCDWRKDREKRLTNSWEKEEKLSADISFFRNERLDVPASDSSPSHSCLWDFQRASHLKNCFGEILYLSQSCSMVKSPAKYSPRRRRTKNRL